MALTELDVGFEVPGPGPHPRIVAEASNLVSAVVVPLVAGLDSGAARKLVIRLWPDGHRALDGPVGLVPPGPARAGRR